jgi:hypothetical protein
MPSLRDSLIHEATSLYRLVDSIDRLVAEHKSIFTYTLATQDFFSEIRNYAEATRKSVSSTVEEALRMAEEESASRYQAKLIIQKNYWKTLHTYVKPAIDAHTLNLPEPLIHMAEEHLCSVPGLKGSEVVILLTPDLMYYQTPESQLSQALVFVEVPYSQGPSFFSNLTIYHELGHYVFDRLAADQGELSKAQEQAFTEKLGQRLMGSNRDWARHVLDAWTTEVFCDLFALRHLGPAYAFALVDFLSLTSLMVEGTEHVFDPEHPAPALRFREQLRRLQEDGWWKTVEHMSSDHISLLTRLANKNGYQFLFSEKEMPVEFLDAFETIIPFIHKFVVAITPHCGTGAEDFSRRGAEIENCLLHGVVPSHLLAEGKASSPTPVSMLNAAYRFYLTRLPEFMNRFEDKESSILQHRKNAIERLEAWTIKGIEDYQLLNSGKSISNDK